MNNKKNENNSIYCNAANCTYNDGDCNCTASHIKVGSPNACKCGETFCGTFEMGSEVNPPKHTL